MKKILFAACALSLVLSSCKKDPEDKPNDPGTGGNNSGSLLVRQVEKDSNTDSTITTYQYDNNKKLKIIEVTDVSGNTSEKQKLTFERNANGYVIRAVEESDAYKSEGVAQVPTVLTYEGTTNRVKSKVTVIAYPDGVEKDSTAYEYGTDGKLSASTSYIKEGAAPYEPEAKVEYIYTGNVVTSQKVYSHDGRTFVHSLTMAIEYDSKVNPLQLSVDESIALAYGEFSTANNVVKVTSTSPILSGLNSTIAVTYTYNSKNLPASSTTTFSGPLTKTFTTVYYYQ